MTSSISWQEFFSGGHPISGSLESFETLSSEYDRLATNVDEIVKGLENYKREDIATFTGEAAHAFNDLTEGVLSLLNEIPDVAAAAKKIFNEHYDALVELRDQADVALGKAQLNWDKYHDAKNARYLASNSIEGQIDDLEELKRKEENASVAFYTAIDSSYETLREDEETQDGITETKLVELGVGKLEDPGFWESLNAQIVDGLLGFVDVLTYGNLDEWINLFNAIVDGDLWAGVWALKDILENMLAVLGIAAIVLGSPMSWIVVGLAVVVFILTVALWKTGEADPNSGRVASGNDVFWSLGNVVAAIVGLKFGGMPDIARYLNAGMGLKAFTFRSGGVIALDTFADVSTISSGGEFLRSEANERKRSKETLDTFLEAQAESLKSGDVEINEKNQVVIGNS